MKPRHFDPKEARVLGESRRERHREIARILQPELAETEEMFEMMLKAEQTGPFDDLVAWIKGFALPLDAFVLAPAAVRGEGAVRREGSDETGAELLAADSGVQVEIAFENRDAAPVWVVVCEQEPDGSLSFVPGDDLAAAPRVPPGDALTFNFMPPSDSVVRVAAIALRQQPSGDPASIVTDPACLHEFGIVATARFTLRVNPPKSE